MREETIRHDLMSRNGGENVHLLHDDTRYFIGEQLYHSAEQQRPPEND